MISAPHRFERHPAAELLPAMHADQFATLEADIAAHGQREAIDLFDGQILDGLNRYRACCELGIEPVVRVVDKCEDPIHYVLSKNLHRRHLTTSQRAQIAVDAEVMFAAAAKERQKRKPAKADDSVVAKLPQQNGRARDEAAKLLSVSPRSVQNAKRLRIKSPELAKAVRSGKISTGAALKQLDASSVERLTEEEQAKLDKYESIIETNLPMVNAAMAVCPRGGAHEADEDGDCAKCGEPGLPQPESTSPDVQLVDIKIVIAKLKSDLKRLRLMLTSFDSIDDSELKGLLKAARRRLAVGARGVNLVTESIKRVVKIGPQGAIR